MRCVCIRLERSMICETCNDTKSVPGYLDEYCPVCKYSVAGRHGHGHWNPFRNACPDCTAQVIGESPLQKLARKHFKPINTKEIRDRLFGSTNG